MKIPLLPLSGRCSVATRSTTLSGRTVNKEGRKSGSEKDEDFLFFFLLFVCLAVVCYNTLATLESKAFVGAKILHEGIWIWRRVELVEEEESEGRI